MATSIKLDPAEKDRLRALADARKRTPHYLMREAIHQYLEREEAREAFRQEALASWQEFRETGRHLTGDDVQTWLRSWGTPDEAEAPDCHD